MTRDLYNCQFKEFVGRSDWMGKCGVLDVSREAYIYENRPQRRLMNMKRDLFV